jgi:hypothetical protein
MSNHCHVVPLPRRHPRPTPRTGRITRPVVAPWSRRRPPPLYSARVNAGTRKAGNVETRRRAHAALTPTSSFGNLPTAGRASLHKQSGCVLTSSAGSFWSWGHRPSRGIAPTLIGALARLYWGIRPTLRRRRYRPHTAPRNYPAPTRGAGSTTGRCPSQGLS